MDGLHHTPQEHDGLRPDGQIWFCIQKRQAWLIQKTEGWQSPALQALSLPQCLTCDMGCKSRERLRVKEQRLVTREQLAGQSERSHALPFQGVGVREEARCQGLFKGKKAGGSLLGQCGISLREMPQARLPRPDPQCVPICCPTGNKERDARTQGLLNHSLLRSPARQLRPEWDFWTPFGYQLERFPCIDAREAANACHCPQR
ncbi:hypothetical protein KSZ_04890 [Dictyobacter formicarum]|uniref:4Fe4S-binding SPASM domain-containing protein n=1 Tax=Dictyobacter formicarum TaxID=2778368 RepID=A0ABQ3V9K1_9CHLR|nr:hypothetical protein KSZ_04890 [Dictyobacter formicarum]